MKKHPVDDLFTRKLTDLKKTPSENAWLKIQAQQKPKHRLMGWIWYAAASLVVGLFGGYLIWKNSQVDSIRPAQNRVIAKQQTVEPKVNNLNAEKSLIAEQEIVATNEEAFAKNETPQPVQKESVTIRKPGDFAQNRSERIVVDVIAKPVEKIAQTTLAEPADISVLPEPKFKSQDQAVVEIAKVEAEQPRTIVVAVESDESEDKPKGSRFSRVFRQLKNARAGERVDWEEVGFNPKTLVARVDDRLRNKEDKALEKIQDFKDRTKL